VDRLRVELGEELEAVNDAGDGLSSQGLTALGLTALLLLLLLTTPHSRLAEGRAATWRWEPRVAMAAAC